MWSILIVNRKGDHHSRSFMDRVVKNGEVLTSKQLARFTFQRLNRQKNVYAAMLCDPDGRIRDTLSVH